MFRTRILGVLAAAASLYLARPGYADPIADFKGSTQLYLRSATATYGGSTTSVAGIDVGKPANALAWTLNAQQFGIPYNIPLTLTLTSTLGSQLTYTIDQDISSVDVDGDGDLLQHLSGTFVVMASAIPGGEATSGDVLLTVVPFLSSVDATGTWGTIAIPIVEASFIAGYPPATLSKFFLASDAEVCSDTAPVTEWLTVTLNSLAPAGGQRVDLSSGAQNDVTMPQFVVVPMNTDHVTFPATIAPSYVGTVPLEASANGVHDDLFFEVDANSSCQPQHGNNEPVLYNPDPDCDACTPIAINDYNDAIEQVDRIDMLISSGVQVSLASLYAGGGVQAMGARSISDGGWITGLLEIGGVTHSYRANYKHTPGTYRLLGTIVPGAVNNAGTVIGEAYNATTSSYQAAWDGGTGTQWVPLASALGATSSIATIISDRAEIIGTYTAARATNGFRWLFGTATATELPVVGTTSGLPVAANASGQIAANGTDASGSPVAALIDAGNNVTLLGAPAGYTSFTAASLNKHGWIVGDAQSTGGARAFVWIPGTGFQPLSGWSTQMPLVQDCSHISDDGTVVVYGTNAAGTTNYFTLKL